jgi:hypothetical protein
MSHSSSDMAVFCDVTPEVQVEFNLSVIKNELI